MTETHSSNSRTHGCGSGAATSGPLSGIRVVELATVLMAPLACQILGDLGADVIKVEAASGDHSRVMGGGPHPQLSGVALNLHRNKRSIQLDLARSEGMTAFLRLLDTADVFVTNFRPKALRKLGLTYETLSASRPRLVYCEAHGFSLESGEADRPAYDDIIQAATGLPLLTLSATEAVNYLPTTIADKVAGLTITYSVLAALLHRAHTSQGQRVEVPMFESALAFNLAEHLARAAVPGGESGYVRLLTPYRRPHKTKDGYIALLPYNDKNWHDLYHAVGHAHELDDPWFQNRLENPGPIYASLGKILRERTTAEWLELAEELGIPAGPVPAMDEIVNDPSQHRGVLSEHEHPVVGPYRQIAPPTRFSRTPASIRTHAPLLGQDTVPVLEEIGLTPEEIENLLASGAAISGRTATGT
ncbi:MULTISPECIES: CaiB/BaiF CoA transferase family protein [unclassified Streptomyces]|uniref:CaiB/BaiF CoA transferase family protein n=1 Tax=unclassified Streptomyces TaxID=2593676 RepID=UPI003D8FD077